MKRELIVRIVSFHRVLLVAVFSCSLFFASSAFADEAAWQDFYTDYEAAERELGDQAAEIHVFRKITCTYDFVRHSLFKDEDEYYFRRKIDLSRRGLFQSRLCTVSLIFENSEEQEVQTRTLSCLALPTGDSTSSTCNYKNVFLVTPEGFDFVGATADKVISKEELNRGCVYDRAAGALPVVEVVGAGDDTVDNTVSITHSYTCHNGSVTILN